MDDRQQLRDYMQSLVRGKLLIPESTRKGQMNVSQHRQRDYVHAYLNYSYLTGSIVPLSEVIKMIEVVPLQVWLKFTCLLSIAFDRGGYELSGQAKLARILAAGPLRAKIVDQVERHGMFLISPRSLASLAKMALAHAREADSVDVEVSGEHLLATYLALADHTEGSVEEFDKDSYKAFTRFIIRNVDFGFALDSLESFTRTWVLLDRIPSSGVVELAVDPKKVFREATGLDVGSFLAAAFAVISGYHTMDLDSQQSVDQHWAFTERLFSKTQLGSEAVRSFLEHLSLTSQDITDIKAQDPEDPNFFYDFTVLRDRPLYRLTNGLVIPIYLPFFRRRITEGLYWDIWYSVKREDKQLQWSQEFGLIFQHYIAELFQRAIPSGVGLAERVWVDPKAKESSPAPDVIISEPLSYIFVEVKGSRYKYEAKVAGMDHAISDDLQKMLYKPVAQLHKSIEYFRSGEMTLGGARWKGETIYPVVVTYDPLPTFDPVWRKLVHDATAGGYLQQQGTRPLTALTPLEAAMLATLAMNGLALDEALEGSLARTDNVSFKNFVLETYQDKMSPPKALERDFEAFGALVNLQLFGVEHSSRE